MNNRETTKLERTETREIGGQQTKEPKHNLHRASVANEDKGKQL